MEPVAFVIFSQRRAGFFLFLKEASLEEPGNGLGSERGKEVGRRIKHEEVSSDGRKYVAVLLTCKSVGGDLYCVYLRGT